jgi:hypothetical protein
MMITTVKVSIRMTFCNIQHTDERCFVHMHEYDDELCEYELFDALEWYIEEYTVARFIE